LASVHRVLIVEDHEPFRRAICHAAALQPDLVTIDIGLPSLNGLEVAGRPGPDGQVELFYSSHAQHTPGPEQSEADHDDAEEPRA